MPPVTIQNPKLESDGAILDVQFMISSELEKKYKEEGKTIPAPITIKAMIDTGSPCSMVKEDIPKKIGINLSGITTIIAPTSDESVNCPEYHLKLVVPNQDISYEGKFVAAPFRKQEVSCLIGRDILSKSILVYVGENNQFTFAIVD